MGRKKEKESGKKDQSKKRYRSTIPKALRTLVWNTHVGEKYGITKCLCGTHISQLNFECGHIVPYCENGKDDINNLRPICSSCNRSMGKKNYDEFVMDLMGQQRGLLFLIMSPSGTRLMIKMIGISMKNAAKNAAKSMLSGAKMIGNYVYSKLWRKEK